MLADESGVESNPNNNHGLSEEVLQVLPSDPFEQLDVARKITSIALSTRVSELESESSTLRAALAEKDQLVADLQAQIESLDASLSETNDKLANAHQEKEDLVKENEALTSKVKKLSRDVSKLEVFKKTLMQSLQEDDENPARASLPPIVAKPTPPDDDVSLPPSRSLSIRSQTSETGNSNADDREAEASRSGVLPGFPLTSQANTPRFTPPGSPPSISASVSPTRTSKPVSPKRIAMSFSTSRGMFDDRSSVFSSVPPSQQSAGRTRVDGKEFFRQVRSRLSYEQFGAFLANVKELNAHKQTREETLQKADEILGPDNKDLYTIFEGLITRNVR